MRLDKLLKQSEPKTNICKICFKDIEQNSFHYLLTQNPTICHDCFLLFGPVLKTFKVEKVKCYFLYYYNEKVQEILYRFKGCKDFELRSVFLEYYANYLNSKFSGYHIVPAPSTENSDKERGFNHVEEMFKMTKLKMLKIIHKTKERKQADLTTKERQKIGKFLSIDDVDLRFKKILIVDDVYTTGSTIKSMIKLVRERGARTIKVLLMSKTIDLEKR